MKAGGWTRQTLGWVLAALTLLGAMGASGWHLWPEARANALAMQPLAQVRAWQAPTAKPPEQSVWLQARATLGRALQIDPHSAELQEAMGYLYVLQAFQPHQGPLLQQAYPHARVLRVEMDDALLQRGRAAAATPWWSPRRWAARSWCSSRSPR